MVFLKHSNLSDLSIANVKLPTDSQITCSWGVDW